MTRFCWTLVQLNCWYAANV